MYFRRLVRNGFPIRVTGKSDTASRNGFAATANLLREICVFILTVTEGTH